MRVALVSFVVAERADEYPIAHSLGAMRLAAYLGKERPNWEVRLRSIADRTGVADAASRFAAEEFDVVGLPAYLWTREAARQIASDLDSLPVPPLVICGGPETQSMPIAEWPNQAIFVMGPGELPLLALCDRRYKDPSFTGTDLGESAELPVFSRSRSRARALRYLVPDRRADKLLPHGFELFGNRFDSLTAGDPIETNFTWFETARGCIYTCSFCGHNTLPFFAVFDLEFVRREIRNMKAKGIKRIFLIDPILGGKPKRGKQLLRLLHEEAPDIEITAYMRPEFLDEEFVDLLARANLVELLMGLQTTNSRVPRHVRGNHIGKILSHVPRLVERGIPWRAELIVGLPGDDLEGLRQSLRFTIEELRPWSVHAYHLTVIPGTQMHSLLGRSEDPYWIEADHRQRVTAASSFDEEDFDRMLVYAGAVTSLYSERAAKGEPIRSLAEAEEIVSRVIEDETLEVTDVFRRLDHSAAVEHWRSLAA